MENITSRISQSYGRGWAGSWSRAGPRKGRARLSVRAVNAATSMTVLQKQFGSQYPNQPGVGDAQRHLDQHGYDREKGTDQRAWDVVGDPK